MARVPRRQETRNAMEAMLAGGEGFELSGFVCQAVKLMI